jgi:hypothetical protein
MRYCFIKEEIGFAKSLLALNPPPNNPVQVAHSAWETILK